jgi:hypothetical protein
MTMNVFIPIDQSWSFKFFEFNKPLISQVEDFFKFSNEFYAGAMLYVITQINFNYGMSTATYNDKLTEAFEICARYPALAPKIAEAYRKLFAEYRLAYMAVGCIVQGATPAVEPSGILQGIVLHTIPQWPPK